MQDPALDNSSPLEASSALIYLSYCSSGKSGYSTVRKMAFATQHRACLCRHILPYWSWMSTWSSDKRHMLAHTITSLKTDGTVPFSRSTLVFVYSFPLKPLPLFRLTSVSPPALFFLVSAHACPQRNINTWRCGEAETLGYLDQIEPVNVKDRPQTVRGVRL